MDFDLNESQYMLQDNLKRYFQKEYPLSRVREVFDNGGELDATLWRAIADLGLLGLLVPEEHGGTGLELLDAAIAAEILGYCSAPGPFTEHVMVTVAIARGGSQTQKERWLPGLASGELRGTIAFAEDGDIWDSSSWATPDGGAVTCVKDWVLHAQGADVVVAGIGDGLVLIDGSSDGITTEPLEGIDRTRHLSKVTFTDVAFEALDGGGDLVRTVLDAGLNLLAADAFGAATRVLEMSVDYAKTREQFGVPIGSFQALKHQIADVAIDLQPSKGLYWYAAHAFDHEPDKAAKFAALSKAHITDAAVNAGRWAVEIHGGIGYTWESDVHVFLKRALLDRAYLGTPQSLRAEVAILNGWPVAS